MTIRELKTINLNRLCDERNIQASELSKLLGAKIQHGSQLLKGKSSLGDKTISKLAKKWEIDEIEFVRLPVDNNFTMNCDVACGEKIKKLCKKVKKVVESKTPYAAALESNILCFEDSINIRRELENIKAVQSVGQGGDIQK